MVSVAFVAVASVAKLIRYSYRGTYESPWGPSGISNTNGRRTTYLEIEPLMKFYDQTNRMTLDW
jgi:hypothetical protein